MKAESLWALSIIAALGTAALLPPVVPIEAQAAHVVVRARLCENTACMAGWAAAKAAEINDAAECHRVATDPEESAGCQAFVQWARDEGEMQAQVERGL
jgi:hypothetical protein